MMQQADAQQTDENKNRVLPKNLSFESGTTDLNYHHKYYYPKLVWSKNKKQGDMEQQQPQQQNTLQQFVGSGERQTKIDSRAGSSRESGVTPAPVENEAASASLSEGQGPRNERKTSNMSETESTDTNFSEDYTNMTDVGEGSDLESRNSTAHDNSASTSGDELFDEAGSSLCTFDRDEKEPSPELSDAFKDIRIDGVKSAQSIKPLVLDMDMTDSVAGLPDPPPSPEADPDQEPQTASSIFEGHKLPADYSTFEGSSFEDREFDFLKTQPPIKRSTSLKSNKTPPGTPSRKKVVRFADALGLDLESVRHILNLEAPPKIPATALRDLQVNTYTFCRQQISRVDVSHCK